MGPAHRSLWDDTLAPSDRYAGPPADLEPDADVVIVGAGLTGLWTAYYLARADPGRSIVVLDRHTVGFGASGRNGGWCSALLPMSLSSLAARHGRGAAIRMQTTMHDTVADVVDVVRHEGIDDGVVRAGTVELVRSDAQHARAHARLEEYRAFGFGDDDHRWLSAAESGERVRATGVTGALFTPHCATVHPARLVHGLARAVTRLGVRIHEHTDVTDIAPRRVITSRGTVTARTVVRATEAYSVGLPGLRRSVVPLYSLMIATERLPDRIWDEIGLDDRPTFADHRLTIIYGQRTADGRLAFGGRGAPYHFGSAIDPRFDTDEGVRSRLDASLRELFPALRDVAITHHWGGPLGVPRDLHASVAFDRATGLAAAGGYVGDGVATTNLAGRTLAHLITGRDSELVRLPWVGHRSRRWEPEPLRWLGINAVRAAASAADRHESGSGTGAGPRSGVARRVMGLLWRR